MAETPLGVSRPGRDTWGVLALPRHPSGVSSWPGCPWVSQSGPRCSQVYLPLIRHPNSDSNDFGCVGILAKSSVSPDGWIISGVIGTRRALVLLQRSRGFRSIRIPVILTFCRLT